MKWPYYKNLTINQTKINRVQNRFTRNNFTDLLLLYNFACPVIILKTIQLLLQTYNQMLHVNRYKCDNSETVLYYTFWNRKNLAHYFQNHCMNSFIMRLLYFQFIRKGSDARFSKIFKISYFINHISLAI